MKIVAIPVGTGGVAWYRIRQPYTYLRDVLGKDIFIYESDKHDPSRLMHETETADIIVYQMPYSEMMRDAVRAIHKNNQIKGRRKRKVVAEFDDYIFGVSPWNDKYDNFGTNEMSVTYSRPEDIEAIKSSGLKEWQKEVKNPDGSSTFTMWKDGKDGFDIQRNLAKLKAASEIISEVDLLTTTTEQLAVQLRKYRPVGKIAVLPNLIDFDRYLPMKKSDTFTIGYQGGSAHFADLALISSEIVEFMKKYPETKLRIAGIQFTSLFKEVADRVTWIPWHGDIETYPLTVRDLACDVAICPLVKDSFNMAKSPLKWEEMSAMRVPCICSPVVYDKFIEHGKDGLIAREGEWVKCLEELMNNPVKRELMAELAYKRVKSRYGLENAKMLWTAFQDLVFGKDTGTKDNIFKFKPETELVFN